MSSDRDEMYNMSRSLQFGLGYFVEVRMCLYTLILCVKRQFTRT